MARRVVVIVLFATGWCSSGGCVLSVGEAEKTVAAPKPPRSAPKFAEITGPGQRIPAALVAREPLPLTETVPTAHTVPADPRPLYTPSQIDPPIVSAIRAHLDHRPADAAEYLRGFDRTNQEILARLLPAVVQAKAADLAQPADAAVLAAQLAAAADAAAKAAPLVVRKACFVSTVKQYGIFTPRSAEFGFLAGGKVMLYAEVGNVVWEPCQHPAGGDGFVAKVKCTLQILDPTGMPVPMTDPETGRPAASIEMPYTDFARSAIHDFFLVFEFQVPTAPGPFTATFDVRDPNSGRAVRRSVPFRVDGG